MNVVETPVVEQVDWIDSGLARSNGWESKDDIVREMHGEWLARSVGFVLHEDEEHLYLAQTQDLFNDAWLNAHAIHKMSIVERKVLG